MGDRERTCAERVAERWAGRAEDFRAILDAEHAGKEPGDDGWPEDLPPLFEYGLAFNYVEPETFDDQPEGYFRYQLSTGGPGDELRFFFDNGASRPYRIEYWFLDWFDGASLDLTGDDLAREVWDQFEDVYEALSDPCMVPALEAWAKGKNANAVRCLQKARAALAKAEGRS